MTKKSDRHEAALKSWRTRRTMSAFAKARAAEAASKEALRLYCNKHGWKLALFEGVTGSPRTGIIDAIAFRLARKNADLVEIRLIQLKGGKAGVSGSEIARLKKAAANANVSWQLAAFDGESLHFLPDYLYVFDRASSPDHIKSDREMFAVIYKNAFRGTSAEIRASMLRYRFSASAKEISRGILSDFGAAFIKFVQCVFPHSFSATAYHATGIILVEHGFPF